MLLSLLIYGDATGSFSSRKIERGTHDSLAFRYIACNRHPYHDTLATFRKRVGTVSLDSTKIHANASRHSALSYAHAEKIEAHKEVQGLLALAEAAAEGLSFPDEIKPRGDRLAAIATAKAKIAARATERFEQEQAEYEAKIAKQPDSGAKRADSSRIVRAGRRPSSSPTGC